MALNAGADAFGMIFASSPRRISWDAAVEIADRVPTSIVPVAVFVDAPHAEIDAVRELFPRALLQFSGNESPEMVRSTAIVRSRRSTWMRGPLARRSKRSANDFRGQRCSSIPNARAHMAARGRRFHGIASRRSFRAAGL